MATSMSKGQIAEAMAEIGAGGKRQMMHALDALAEIAHGEIAAGEDFTVPGVAKISWAYTSPRAKGEMYKKGETYIGFGGQETVAEADSKERKAKVALKASPVANLKRLAPKGTDKAGQRSFLSKKVGQHIASRKR